MILNTTGLFYRIKKLPKKYFVALLVYLLYMTTVLLSYMFYHVEILIVIGMSLFALVSFALILSDNMERICCSSKRSPISAQASWCYRCALTSSITP